MKFKIANAITWLVKIHFGGPFDLSNAMEKLNHYLHIDLQLMDNYISSLIMSAPLLIKHAGKLLFMYKITQYFNITLNINNELNYLF